MVITASSTAGSRWATGRDRGDDLPRGRVAERRREMPAS
jgi:hypothetical protein